MLPGLSGRLSSERDLIGDAFLPKCVFNGNSARLSPSGDPKSDAEGIGGVTGLERLLVFDCRRTRPVLDAVEGTAASIPEAGSQKRECWIGPEAG